MKKKELIEIIRFAVRQELKKSLPAIIKECVNPTPKPKVRKRLVRETDPVQLAKQVLKTETKVVSAPKKKNLVKYAKDPALNEALNATLGGVPQDGGLSRVGAEGITSDEGLTDLSGNPVNEEDLPPELSAALTRNYSDLLGAIDKKRNGGA
jgi:hypothetical protein